jgi:hypothetical protein
VDQLASPIRAGRDGVSNVRPKGNHQPLLAVQALWGLPIRFLTPSRLLAFVSHDDGAGARCLKRVVERIKDGVSKFRELESLNGRGG